MSLNLLSLNLDCTVLRKGRLFNFQKTVYILSDETFRYKSLIEMTSWAPTAHTPRHTHSNSWVHNICIRLLVKGQLISKELVGILNSSIKRIKKFNLQYYDTSGRLVFVRFLEELKTPKSPFENNWPLLVCLFYAFIKMMIPILALWMFNHWNIDEDNRDIWL